MDTTSNSHSWLRQYGNLDEYRWRRAEIDRRPVFERPLGLVESAFDADGQFYEGRADISNMLEVEITSNLTTQAYRERILLAWTRLRYQYLLLQSRCMRETKTTGRVTPLGRHFIVDIVNDIDEALSNARKHTVFLEDHVSHPDAHDFLQHCMNVGRVVDTDTSMSELFVFPPEAKPDGHAQLKFLFIGAHQVWDGLTNLVANRDFVSYLNIPANQLRLDIEAALSEEHMKARLPLPQEALYHNVPGPTAKQRWFWAITRVLRHVRKQLPPGFPNPLQRKGGRAAAETFPLVYNRLLDYTKVPPLNTHTFTCKMSLSNTQRLHRLCKEANVSIGAGCFAVAAVIMMEMYEQEEPDLSDESRKCFISGFPLNPRAFFNHHTEPNSLMLAFSDGIALPFLPSFLNLEGRIRLLARQAHRQLASYQKRKRPTGAEVSRQLLKSRGAGLVLANQYLSSLERVDSILPAHLRSGVSVQGEYPARLNPTSQTCGVSSVGSRDAIVRRGVYRLDDASKDFAADFVSQHGCVRARDGEFLVGIVGSSEGLLASVSADSSAMDPGLMAQWRYKFEHILDGSDNKREARL